MRKLIGFMLFVVGIVVLLADVHVAYVAKSSAHALNVILGAAICFAGGYVMLPTLAEALADSLVKHVPALASLWPGGLRKYDPPAQPGVPPPPSITGEPPVQG
jgi:hypothetical protein